LMRKKFLMRVFSLLLFLIVGNLYSQDINTASDLFKKLSAAYEEIQDYTAKISILQNKESMAGNLSYKAPYFFRIDFTDPPRQVFVSDGKLLQIYLPRYSVTFNQQLRKPDDASPVGLATGQGLKLLKNSYSIGYLNGPEQEPLEEGSSEMVYKLKLNSSGELYRSMEMSIQVRDERYYIRRIIGNTVSSNTIQLDFQDIKTNQEIPLSKFQFDSPPSANTVRNFLFEPEG